MFKQWRIQDFLDGSTNPQDGGANLLFGQILPENCMKMKEFRPKEGVCIPGDPLRFANVLSR